MIKICEVKPFAEKYFCDKCETGEMLPTGENIWLTDPPQFHHKCNNCGYEDKFYEKYPCVKFQITES